MSENKRYSQSELRRIGYKYLAQAIQRVYEYEIDTATEIASVGILAALLGIAEDLSRLAGIKNTERLVEEL